MKYTIKYDKSFDDIICNYIKSLDSFKEGSLLLATDNSGVCFYGKPSYSNFPPAYMNFQALEFFYEDNKKEIWNWYNRQVG